MKKLLLTLSATALLLVVPDVANAQKPSWAGKGKPSKEQIEDYKAQKKYEKEMRKKEKEEKRERMKEEREYEREKRKDEMEAKRERMKEEREYEREMRKEKVKGKAKGKN